MLFNHEGVLVKITKLLDFKKIYSIFKKTKSVISSVITKVYNQKVDSIYTQMITNTLITNSLFLRRYVFTAPILLSGLFALKNSHVPVSFSPATIIELDYEKEKIIDLFQYSHKLEVCPNGLKATLGSV